MYGATGHPRIVGMEGGKLTDVTALRAPFMCGGQWTRGSRCLIIGQGDDWCSRKAEVDERHWVREYRGYGFHRHSDRSRPNITACFASSPERERQHRSNIKMAIESGSNADLSTSSHSVLQVYNLSLRHYPKEKLRKGWLCWHHRPIQYVSM